MTQELVSGTTKSVAMQVAEQRLGRPLEEYLRERYLEQRWHQRQIAAELGIDVGSVSRWMARLGIPARPTWHRERAAG